ncbi:hypothetical protein [Maioricimonas sp. JC845]|uniref:hypothetical protein n=1 Tax=Maioricimonas sp. JC845 TaxID=3232138 RepID=UPI0034594565
MSRTMRTVVALICATASFRLYATMLRPWTIPGQAPPPTQWGTAGAVRPPIFEQVASRYLPQVDWLAHSKYKVQRSDEAFLFFDHWTPIDDGEGNKVELTPFALVWTDPRQPGQAAYIVRCESARLQFESPFETIIGDASPGRITGAALTGQVHVSGPDGLKLAGRDFWFSESGRQLYSDHPVTFGYGPQPGEASRVSGKADRVRIELLASADPVLGKDMPRIAGIDRIELPTNVEFDLHFEQDGHLTQTRITCAGPFEYDAQRHILTFEDDVRMARPTDLSGEKQGYDTLRCDWLALLFEKAPASEVSDEATGLDQVVEVPRLAVSDNASSLGSKDVEQEHLRFRRLRAIGDRIHLHSDGEDVTASMQELRYDSQSRVLAMLDDEAVVVQQAASKLMSREITLVHTEENELQQAWCRGKGRLDYVDEETGEVAIRALWEDQLQFHPEGESGLQFVELVGEARVIQPRQTGILADRLQLWLDPIVLEAARRESREQKPDSRISAMPVRRAEAIGSVFMSGAEFEVKTDRLTATFETGTVTGEGSSLNRSRVRQAGHDDGPTKAGDQWRVSCGEIQVALVYDPQRRQTELASIDAGRSVRIAHIPEDQVPRGDAARAGVIVNGQSLHATQGADGQMQLKLLGQPARLVADEVELEGDDVRVDRDASRFDVVGPGVLKLLVDRTLQGDPLEHPEWMDVAWKESMGFDGQTALFASEVHASVQQTHLYCDEMEVVMGERIDFSARLPDDHEPQLDRVVCRNGVRLESYIYEGAKLIGLTRATLAEFTLDHTRGTFEGLGPGHIDNWRYGRTRRIAIEPGATKQTRDPDPSNKLPWEYARISFAGMIDGNINHQTAVLHDWVQILYAPVAQPLQQFERDQLSSNSESASKAAWLGCDQLRVAMREQPDSDDSYVQLLGWGNAELEGQLFRALAHEVSFDESKELFTLRGRGDNKAVLYYQERPGARESRAPAQTIQFIPSRSWIKLDGATGISGVE